jgi:anti-sigma regulatory factor (Ser/Thr protein kinase)
MTRAPRPAGFLMHDSWRPDLVLAHKRELASGPRAAGVARRWVAELLSALIGRADMHDVALLVSEVVTNAVRHGGAGAGGTIVVHVAIGGEVLRVEVCDHGPGFVAPAAPRRRADGGGHGLMLVEHLSSSWGVSGDDGTCVWFERALAPRG